MIPLDRIKVWRVALEPKPCMDRWQRDAENFATRQLERDNYYAEARDDNPEYTWLDCATGKYMEFAAQSFVHHHKFRRCHVDTTVYDNPADKSFAFDLMHDNGSGWHVKSGTKRSRKMLLERGYAPRDAYTWTFQLRNANGRRGTDDLLKLPYANDMVILVHANSPADRSPRILATAPWYALYPLLTEPMLNKKARTKRCLYLVDLEAERILTNFGNSSPNPLTNHP